MVLQGTDAKYEYAYAAKNIMEGKVQGGRRRGRQRKRWDDNIKDWTGLELRITLRRVEQFGEENSHGGPTDNPFKG
ncbi:UDP-glucuronosyltransferase 2a1-like [Plakobranchus ocellatus]|uniref:UDP-glucuronosyltransferase 2a1-like n=1 Tax=Plakobranchus ocellatus TaxID=259542 RepID=A0AAV4AI46_9GAST|nr:UDP-glucuronosyltransferase 2a1-like [Plakobranchus ocellatus]